MRILYFHHNSDLYGASRSLCRMAGSWVEAGHRVTVVLPESGVLAVTLQDSGAEVVEFPDLAVVDRASMQSWKGRFGLLKRIVMSLIRLPGVIRRAGADIVHTNSSVVLIPGLAARLVGVPHVWHVREIYSEFSGFWKWYRRWMVLFSDRIICISRAVADQFDGVGDGVKVQVIHNGIPKEEFASDDSEEVGRFRAQYGLEDHFTFINAGRIKLGRKGQETFVQAAAKVKERFPDVRYIIAGAPFPGNESHLEELEGVVSAHGLEEAVVFTGDLKNVYPAFRAADVEVLTSAQPEPLGNVVIEAMALKRAVIATAIGGPLEMVEDGVTGLLVPPGDPEALAEAMARMVGDRELCRRMGEAGRQKYEREFEFEPFFEKIRTIYHELIAQDTHLGCGG